MSTAVISKRVSAPSAIIRPRYAVILALVGVGVIFALRIHRPEVHVRVVSPSVGSIETSVSSVGTVRPVEDFPARANFSGIVEKIYVHLGETVHAGQPLIVMKDQYALSRLRNARVALDDAEIKEQVAENRGTPEDQVKFSEDLARAQQEQSNAAQALATLQDLESRGSVSEAEVAAGKQRLNTANAALKSLQQERSVRYSKADIASSKDRVAADKASLDAERVSYRNAHIVSAIDGEVYLLPVSQYDFVAAGSDLLHVADMSRLQVRADFNEFDMAKLHDGQAALITWEGNSAKQWHGHVTLAPLAANKTPNGSVGECTIAIDDVHQDLPLNTNVTVSIVVDKRANAVTIPRDTLHDRGSEHFVYRVVDGRLKETPVKIGLINPLQAEVLSGVTPQDQIAVAATDDRSLSNDMKVTPSR